MRQVVRSPILRDAKRRLRGLRKSENIPDNLYDVKYCDMFLVTLIPGTALSKCGRKNGLIFSFIF